MNQSILPRILLRNDENRGVEIHQIGLFDIATIKVTLNLFSKKIIMRSRWLPQVLHLMWLDVCM